VRGTRPEVGDDSGWGRVYTMQGRWVSFRRAGVRMRLVFASAGSSKTAKPSCVCSAAVSLLTLRYYLSHAIGFNC
jgi:hypothetical protein